VCRSSVLALSAPDSLLFSICSKRDSDEADNDADGTD
jgi:hypothetical protein